MKLTLTPTTLAIIFAAVVLGIAPMAKADDRGCPIETFKGTFAYTSTGFLVAPSPPPFIGPYAEVGTQTFDGKGSVSFNFNSSTNGNIGPVTGTAGTGTYTVNDDCTGTFNETSQGFTSHFSFVIDQSGGGFQAICQDAGAVVTRAARRLSPGDNWRR